MPKEKNKRHDFSDLLSLAKTMRQKNKWHKDQTIARFSKYLIEEAREIHSAAQKKDWDELHEEIGDLMWDLAFLSHIAEEKQLFSIHDSIRTAHQKIVRRNPHIFARQKAKKNCANSTRKSSGKKKWKKRSQKGKKSEAKKCWHAQSQKNGQTILFSSPISIYHEKKTAIDRKTTTRYFKGWAPAVDFI